MRRVGLTVSFTVVFVLVLVVLAAGQRYGDWVREIARELACLGEGFAPHEPC